MLCEKNLRFHSGLCERALIVGNNEGVDQCSLRADSPAHSAVYPVAINKYVLVTIDDHLELRCEGQQTRRFNVKPEPYLLTFATPDCQLQGVTGWVLDSLAIFQARSEIAA